MRAGNDVGSKHLRGALGRKAALLRAPAALMCGALVLLAGGWQALSAQEGTAPPGGEAGPAGPACTDFSSQEAQAFFEAQGGPQNDAHGLDPDGDGVACNGPGHTAEASDASSQEALEPSPALGPAAPDLPRTAPRNTASLVERLEPLTEWGLPLRRVLVEAMGRFPVAGIAYYSDDWLNPRRTPTPHLHKGLDIFADFGTPIRAPHAGVVTRFSDDPSAGGTALWTRDQEGTEYYYGHLLERAEGLEVGQSIELGTILGSVGDSGNAKGGAPHLHLEIHRDGVAVPPKPLVDAWLDEAEAAAEAWMEARRSGIVSARATPEPTVEPEPVPTQVPTAAPSLRATSASSRTLGITGAALVLGSWIFLSLGRRRRPRSPRHRKAEWDEYKLISW